MKPTGMSTLILLYLVSMSSSLQVVATAFLYAPLLASEVIYCFPPKGYHDHEKFGDGGKVMKLKRALYTLRHRSSTEALVRTFGENLHQTHKNSPEVQNDL